MLSVCKAAAEAAAELLERDPMVRSRDVLTTSARAAREALARTPDQLQLLKDAGVAVAHCPRSNHAHAHGTAPMSSAVFRIVYAPLIAIWDYAIPDR